MRQFFKNSSDSIRRVLLLLVPTWGYSAPSHADNVHFGCKKPQYQHHCKLHETRCITDPFWLKLKNFMISGLQFSIRNFSNDKSSFYHYFQQNFLHFESVYDFLRPNCFNGVQLSIILLAASFIREGDSKEVMSRNGMSFDISYTQNGRSSLFTSS